jgi:hypothetical protein
MTPPGAYLGERRFPWFDVALPVVGRVPQFPDQDLRGTVWNIGRGGLMAEFPVELVPGSQVTLTFHTRNGFLLETGRVVWAASPCLPLLGMGRPVSVRKDAPRGAIAAKV